MCIQGPPVGPGVRRRAGAGTDVGAPLPGIEAPLQRLIRIGGHQTSFVHATLAVRSPVVLAIVTDVVTGREFPARNVPFVHGVA